ncbi:MAG: fasciclin domain-containing protein [Bacteroidetes bacterium]|nr:MAG: fasciclin domain-containing protein [Bacteroidota bacterium]
MRINTFIPRSLSLLLSTSALAALVLLVAACADTPRSADESAETETVSMTEEAPATTIVDIATSDERFSTLVTALQAADLVSTLQGEGPFTVFAPTNEAFAALPEGTVENLLKPENKDQLTAILLYHVAEGKVMAAQVTGMDEVPTLQGGTLSVQVEDGTVMIGSATVVQADVEASNGVIHVIDTVLLPPSDTQ